MLHHLGFKGLVLLVLRREEVLISTSKKFHQETSDGGFFQQSSVCSQISLHSIRVVSLTWIDVPNVLIMSLCCREEEGSFYPWRHLGLSSGSLKQELNKIIKQFWAVFKCFLRGSRSCSLRRVLLNNRCSLMTARSNTNSRIFIMEQGTEMWLLIWSFLRKLYYVIKCYNSNKNVDCWN